MASLASLRALAMWAWASWLPMPRLPEWSTTQHPGPLVDAQLEEVVARAERAELLGSLGDAIAARSVAGWWPASHRSALRATVS